MTPTERKAALRDVRALADEYESLMHRWREASAGSQEVADLHATFKDRERKAGRLFESGAISILLRELLAEPQGEPVAWALGPDAMGPVSFVSARTKAANPLTYAQYDVPLYAHPQQRKQLPVDQLAKLIAQEWGTSSVPSGWHLARAIERAHGITGEPT